MLADRLSAVEDSGFLMTTLGKRVNHRQLVVNLPRYRLSFFVNGAHELESKELRDMVVDKNQSAGTMIGLRSRLILRSRTLIGDRASRRVLIVPFGDLEIQSCGNHVTLTVIPDPAAAERGQIHYLKYEIHEDLGMLMSTTLTSALYKILLHACTSHCLVDPLTGRTGTEEALGELASAGCFSFQSLAAEEVGLLAKIAALTPERVFYPAHLEVMAAVKWGSARGIMQQHHAFRPLVHKILDYASELLIFQGRGEIMAYPLVPDWKRNSEKLRARAASQFSKSYPPESAHYTRHSDHDIAYHVESAEQAEIGRVEAAKRAVDVSAMVQSWTNSLKTTRTLWHTIESWTCVSGDAHATDLSLSYTRSFLESDFLQRRWLSVFSLLQTQSGPHKRSSVTFTFAAMAYQLPEYEPLIPTLLAVATTPAICRIPIPNHPIHMYDFTLGETVQREPLVTALNNHVRSFEGCSYARLPRLTGEDYHEFYARRSRLYRLAVQQQVGTAVDRLVEQWPCETPLLETIAGSDLVNVADAMQEVKRLFVHWFRNREFRAYVNTVQLALNQIHTSFGPSHAIPPIQSAAGLRSSRRHFSFLSLTDLFDQRLPPKKDISMTPPPMRYSTRLVSLPLRGSTASLEHICDELTLNGSTPLQKLYAAAVEASRRKLVDAPVPTHSDPPTSSALTQHHETCQRHFGDAMQEIRQSLSPITGDTQGSLLAVAGQNSRITLRSLLAALAGHLEQPQWRSCLVTVCQCVLRLQRSQRLTRFDRCGMTIELHRELVNDPPEEDSLFSNAEALLLQIDGNFLIRPTQSTVASEMLHPSSGSNTVLQFNMGEGKTSVVAPLVAARSADGSALVRVVVLRPLARQAFLLLRKTLSGLLNRRIFYLPFSRDLQVNASTVDRIHSLFALCMREGGILLAQPEHLLSFRLMGIDLSLPPAADKQVANKILESQRWLDRYARDILDESDEILNVAYQLVYTRGSQSALEDHPDRWTVVQNIFALAKKHAAALHHGFPNGVELTLAGEDTFPTTFRILDQEAGNYLVRSIGEEILDSLQGSHFLPSRLRSAALQFITNPAVPATLVSDLEHHCRSTTLWNGLLLRRGMLAGGILGFALEKKRYRVDYGLDLTRTMLAVPYRAKDVPSPRADFGHPDVALSLTCLSYYYRGLSMAEFDRCLELLFALDNPPLEYQGWVREHPTVPPALRSIIGLNMEDIDQRRKTVYPLFQRTLAVVDFYLRQVVFPKEAKQFPSRIATSAWDLAARKSHVTTGFSGTNDAQYLLPISIDQRDPADQLSTNAKVLSYLLQPENNHYLCVQNSASEPVLSEPFMDILLQQDPEIRVLLDVGAQMMDKKNAELAHYWLHAASRTSNTIEAVVYFGDSDELMVLSKQGPPEAFASSSFSDRLDVCAVYLDDEHTRGTDLKLPQSTRAAVTLGPGLSKDRLVQGCMRMRQLGHGQSVMFFAPPDVDRRIKDTRRTLVKRPVSVVDILEWVMLETVASIEHHIPYWAQQGVSYKNRLAGWNQFDLASSPEAERLSVLHSLWVEKEARTLEEMYCPSTPPANRPPHPAFEIPDMKVRLDSLGVTSVIEASMDEEQEREVAHEIERESQVERPPPMDPAPHNLHPDVRHLISTGIVRIASPAFARSFTLSPELYAIGRWSSTLLATQDFLTTTTRAGYPKDYLRPVNWILSAMSNGAAYLVVLSPYEVDQLLPEICANKSGGKVYLHIYAAQTTQDTKTFEYLNFHAIPHAPPAGMWSLKDITQLNLWSGQLYLRDEQEYHTLCMMLGLFVNEEVSGASQSQVDGFVKLEHRSGKMKTTCLVSSSPLALLKDLISTRRKGLNFAPTHMGKILHAGTLTSKDFVDASNA